jgi:16S rRNA processing protein RimM
VPEDLVQVGHVTGAYGLRGGIRITPYSTDADALLNVKSWWLDKPAVRPGRVRSA